MFTIEYLPVSGESALQTFDSHSRNRLVLHLANFQLPILAVYEQASPVTSAMRRALASYTGPKSAAADNFIAGRISSPA